MPFRILGALFQDVRLKFLLLCFPVAVLVGCASEYITGPVGTGPSVLFASDRNGNSDIYAMNPDGSGLVRLTNHPASDRSPSWSPDGQKILFVSNRALATPQDPNGIELYVMSADGSDVTRLTTNALHESSPSWSPDGTKILFSTSASRGRIYTINADGSGLVQLSTNDEWADSVPRWSPDGTRIAFISSRNAGRSLLYSMKPDGTAVVRVQTQFIGTINSFGWSPDSYSIVYEYGTWPYGGIFRVEATPRTGNFPVELADYPLLPSNPVWSPDGSRIAFTVGIGGNFEVYTMSAINGGGKVNITNSPAADRVGAWK